MLTTTRTTGIAALVLLAAVLLVSAPTASATPAAYARTCYATSNYTACLSATEWWNGSTAGSVNRQYSCSAFILGPAKCDDHQEGSYWNASLRMWEDWANTSYTLVFSPFVKACVYLRLDISPSGAHTNRAWASGPVPLTTHC